MRGKEEMESGSGSEQLEDRSGNEQESSEQPPKKKRYHRHTAAQIQEMEAYVTNLFLHISLIFLNIYEYMPLLVKIATQNPLYFGFSLNKIISSKPKRARSLDFLSSCKIFLFRHMQ